MTTVTGEIIEMGDVRYEQIGSNVVRELPRGVIVQFSSVEDFKRAISGTANVRFEWNVTNISVSRGLSEMTR